MRRVSRGPSHPSGWSRRRFLVRAALGVTLPWGCRPKAPMGSTVAQDLGAVREGLGQRLPAKELERSVASPPPLLRGSTDRAPHIYRQRVGGVVLIMAEDGIGAGALVSPMGDIVTNEHVVKGAYRRDGAEWVAVWLKSSPASSRIEKDGFLLARVMAKDVRSDLAVVRLVKAPPATATPIPLAPTLPEIGQDVFAIGHPVGLLWSFTQGIVSQIRQNHEWTYADGVPRRATAIQTQTPTVPGSSGGPLLNDDGRIVGIIMAGATGTQGFNFAVSVEHVRALLDR